MDGELMDLIPVAPAPATTVPARKRNPGHFEKEQDDYTLLEQVRAVAEYASPGVPTSCARDAFNAARAPAGYPDLITGNQIANRLRLPWATVLEIAVAPANERAQRLGVAQSDRGREGFSLGQVLSALVVVARFLDRPGFPRSDYEPAHEKLTARSLAKRRHGYAAADLPTSNQVTEVLIQHKLTWEQALREAGLEPAVTQSAASRPRGLDATEAVTEFAATTDLVPRNRDNLRDWAAARRVSLRDRLSGPQIRAAVETLQARSVVEGLLPLDQAEIGMTFDHVDPLATPETYYKPGTAHWNDETIVAGMAKAIAYLLPGQRLTQRRLNRIAWDHPGEGIPGYSSVQRWVSMSGKTSFDKLIRAAYKQAGLTPARRSGREAAAKRRRGSR